MKIYTCMHSILLCFNINVLRVKSKEFLGGKEVAQIFLCSAASLQEEDLIKQSPKGQSICPILKEVGTMQPSQVCATAAALISKIHECITHECIKVGNKHKLLLLLKTQYGRHFINFGVPIL